MIDENNTRRTSPNRTSEMEQSDEYTPVLRVWLMDSGRLAWRVPPCYEQEPWSSRRTARAIFFLLLCAPNRQALRGQLIGILWPETPEENAQSNLRSALKVLRQVLRQPPGDDPLMEATQNREALQLKGQEIIWTDVDALELLVQQAGQEPDPQRAFLLWQQARALLKGEVLAEDRLHEWVSYRWIKVKRHRMQALRRHVIRSLADLFVQRGEQGQAITLLQEHIISFPTDQDALYRLLKLLMQAECFEEARATYERGKAALQSLGKPITESVKGIAEHLMTQNTSLSPPSSAPVPSGIQIEENITLSQLTTAISQSIIMTMREVGSREIDAFLAQTNVDQEPRPAVNLAAPEEPPLDLSRRIFNTPFLSGMISTATVSFLDPEVWERLVVSVDQPLAFNRDSIEAFQHCMDVCWEFCNCGKMSLAEHLLLTFLPTMQKLAEHQKEAAQLVAEGLRLQSILSAHQLKMTEKLLHCLQSVKYARLACEPNTLVSSLHELTAALRYTRQFDAMFLVFEEGVSLSKYLLPPIRAGIYAGFAAALAQRNRRKEADSYLHQSYEIFAERTIYDTLAVTDNTFSHLAEYEGIAYLEMGQSKKAYGVFERFTTSSPEIVVPERNRLEMLNYQGRAALQLGDVEMYVNCLEKGIEGAIAIQSKKRLEEALEIFTQELPPSWLLEPRMKRVVERFQLTTRS